MAATQAQSAPLSGVLDSVLTWQQLRTVIPLSRPQVWRLRQTGAFPAPIKLSQNRVGWRTSDVRAWLDARPTA